MINEIFSKTCNTVFLEKHAPDDISVVSCMFRDTLKMKRLVSGTKSTVSFIQNKLPIQLPFITLVVVYISSVLEIKW